MNKNLVLEIKQTDGIAIQNGEFVNNLKPITIYDQDQISINKVFIDTEAQTDALIDIPFDIEIRTKHVLSITNDNQDKFANFSDGSSTIDNIPYYVYDITAQGHPAEPKMKHITKIEFLAQDITKDIGDPDGTNPIEFKYNDLVGNSRRIYISFPRQSAAGSQDLNQFPVSIFIQLQGTKDPRISQGEQIQIVNTPSNILRCNKCNIPTQIEDNGQRDDPTCIITFSNPAAGSFTEDNLTPHLFDNRMSIPQGKYLAQDMCNLITNNFSQNNHSNSFAAKDNVVSQFLVNSSNFNTPTTNLLVANFDSGGGGSGGLNLQSMRSGTLHDNFFIGSNQVQLSYNTTNGKFFFNFLHFPVYNNSGNICTRIIGTQDPIFAHQTRNGCICFTEMTAVNLKTQEPFGFWDDKLGFQMDRICVKPLPQLSFDDNGSIFHAELISSSDGINTTNAKVDLDSIVQKTPPTGTTTPYTYQKVQAVAPFDFVENNFNTIVEANTSIVSAIADLTIPYFLIEMNAGFHNDLISTDKSSSTIQAIVDRYYSKGAYTMGSPNSITYTHRGQPLVLSKFYTRILQPDRTVPKQLGDDNTIFIEIIRNNEFYLMKRELEIQQEIQAQQQQEQQSQNKTN